MTEDHAALQHKIGHRGNTLGDDKSDEVLEGVPDPQRKKRWLGPAVQQQLHGERGGVEQDHRTGLLGVDIGLKRKARVEQVCHQSAYAPAERLGCVTRQGRQLGQRIGHAEVQHGAADADDDERHQLLFQRRFRGRFRGRSSGRFTRG